MTSYAIAEAVRQGLSLQDLCPIVDLHVHAGPHYNFAILGHDADSMVRMMDRVGIQALVVAPHLSIGPAGTDGNDLALSLTRAYPGRLLGYAVPYPHEPETARDELNRAFDAGLVAIKLHPSMHHYRAVDPGYRVAWEVAQERNSFILTHTWHGDRYCTPAMLTELAQEYPTVPVIIGHSGGTPEGFPEFIALAKSYPNFYLDTTGSNVTGPWVKRMVQEVGADRVVYGSDIPFIDPRYGLGKVTLSGLDDDQLRQVIRDNGRRLLARAGVQL
ncbi:MAG: amidohydrolase family protein [Anaerolineae bacterium]